jgi:hypothetical protein
VDSIFSGIIVHRQRYFPLVLWVCNSLIWGIAIVAIMNRIVENKKTNHRIEPTRDTPAAGQ